MTNQFHCVAVAAFIAAVLSIEIPIAQANNNAVARSPPNPNGRCWSYRLINGRKCWYEGGLSKSLLEWTRQTSAPAAPAEEITRTVPEKPRNLATGAPSLPFRIKLRHRVHAAIDTGNLPRCICGQSVTTHSLGQPDALGASSKQKPRCPP
jgi:hypothetical protein